MTQPTLKIYVYAIAKNEQQFVERFMHHAHEADGVIIADTGSTDQTIRVAQQMGARVHRVTVTPWRFDMARNLALNYVPEDADVCISVDLDEVLQEGWRRVIEQAWTPETTRMRFLFDHGQGRFMADKIHARHGYWWRMPCHEHLVADPRVKEVFAETPSLLLKHLPDPRKPRAQYLELLWAAHREATDNLRAQYYLGRELFFRQDWPRVLEILLPYVEKSTWPNERSHALEMLATARLALGQVVFAVAHIQKALESTPNRRESWVALADYHRRQSQWVECAAAARRALAITTGQDDWPSTQSAWTWQVYDLLALSSYFLGDYPSAIDFGQKALDAAPDDGRLKENMGFYLTHKST